MNIAFTDTQARENNKATCLIPWNKRENALARSKVFMAFSGLVVLGLFYTPNQAFSLHDFYLGLFLTMLLIQFAVFRRYQKQKQLFLADNTRLADIMFREDNSASISISDSGYLYDTPAYKAQFAWEMFTAYSVFEDFLLLHLDSNERQFITIEKNCLDDQQWDEVYEFVSTRLKPFTKSKNQAS